MWYVHSHANGLAWETPRMARSRKRFYAWRVGDQEGITTTWPECQRIVHGRNARYKGFATREEAEAWLRAGARYGPWDDGVTSPWMDRFRGPVSQPQGARSESEQAPVSTGRPRKRVARDVPQAPTLRGPLPQDAVYFDSGTGRGHGTEVNVTTWDRKPLAHLVAPNERLTPFNTVQLSPGRTNNYGELLACLLAIRVARRLGLKTVCGDSRLALDYWSRGLVKRSQADADPDLARLVEMTAAERAAFEADGGTFYHVSGARNPADLGFHGRRRTARRSRP